MSYTITVHEPPISLSRKQLNCTNEQNMIWALRALIGQAELYGAPRIRLTVTGPGTAASHRRQVQP